MFYMCIHKEYHELKKIKNNKVYNNYYMCFPLTKYVLFRFTVIPHNSMFCVLYGVHTR